MKIVGISGSLRKKSTHRGILRKVGELLENKNVGYATAEIGDFPIYNQDENEKGIPDEVMRVHDQLKSADAIVLASPEYNYSISGALKNAIDWLSRVEGQAFSGKAVAIMGASPGGLGTARSQYHLRQIMVFMDVHFVNKPEVMIAKSFEKFDKEGNLHDTGTIAHIEKQLDALLKFGEKLK